LLLQQGAAQMFHGVCQQRGVALLLRDEEVNGTLIALQIFQ